MRIERANVVARSIRQRIPLSNTSSAMEYGCGTGLVSFALQDYLGQICLADSSSGMLSVLQNKIQAAGLRHMHPLKLDLCSEPLPAQRFDLVYSLMTLHHIPDTRQILGAFYDILKPGGWLCLADLDKEDGTFHDEEFNGHFGFDREELQTLLAELGYTNIRFDTVYSMYKIRNDQQRIYPLFLLSACKN